MPAPIVDTHCHLDFSDFANEQDALLERARALGVRWFVTIGASDGLASAPRAVSLAKKHSDVVCSVGVHPHEASVVDDAAVALIASLAEEERVVAVGEVGLDYHYDYSPREVQRAAFRRFVQLALTLKKPLVIHTRNAPEDTLAILREENAREVGGVIHCFSEDRPFARGALELGFDISFSGIVTFKRSEELRAVAKLLPKERILVETDAPFLAPIPFRGKRNEPSYVTHTAAFLAKELGMTEDAFRSLTTENAIRRFALERFEAKRTV